VTARELEEIARSIPIPYGTSGLATPYLTHVGDGWRVAFSRDGRTLEPAGPVLPIRDAQRLVRRLEAGLRPATSTLPASEAAV
jgi:hypothetical protein